MSPTSGSPTDRGPTSGMTPSGADLRAIALSPRWLLALLAALLFAAACIPLGLWQWQRTQDIVESERASLLDPIDVADVTVPGQPISAGDAGRTVLATGTWEPRQQVLITSREVDGRPGVWAWTPLRLADGTTVGVLRGWLPDGDAPGVEPPTGTVSVRGTLVPDEPFYADAPVADGRALAIDSLRLGPSGTRGGFVMLAEQQPSVQPAPVLVPVEGLATDLAFPIRNFLYSFQWWIFGVFALVAWAVMAWREARDRHAQSPDGGRVDALQPGTVAPHE